MQVTIDFETPKFHQIAHTDIAGPQMLGIPGLGALTLTAVVALWITAWPNRFDPAPEGFTTVYRFNDRAGPVGQRFEDDVVSERPEFGLGRQTSKAVISDSDA